MVCLDALNLPVQEIEVGGPEILSHQEIAMLAFEALGKPPRISYVPDWLRICVLRSLQLLTRQTFHGPVEFFLTVMAMDMIAPEYGSKTLKEFFAGLHTQ